MFIKVGRIYLDEKDNEYTRPCLINLEDVLEMTYFEEDKSVEITFKTQDLKTKQPLYVMARVSDLDKFVAKIEEVGLLIQKK